MSEALVNNDRRADAGKYVFAAGFRSSHNKTNRLIRPCRETTDDFFETSCVVTEPGKGLNETREVLQTDDLMA